MTTGTGAGGGACVDDDGDGGGAGVELGRRRQNGAAPWPGVKIRCPRYILVPILGMHNVQVESAKFPGTHLRTM
jgi:hypothetical protein